MATLDWILGTILFLQTTFLRIDAQSFNIPTPPKTNFSCLNKPAGFYADTGSSCRIYHTCDEYGNKFTYHCPEETAFRQDALICDHAHLVRCFGRENSNVESRGTKLNATCAEDSTKEGTNLNATRSSKEENKRTRFGFSFNSREATKDASAKVDNKGNLGKFYRTNSSVDSNVGNRNRNFPVNSTRNFSGFNGDGNGTKFYRANIRSNSTSVTKNVGMNGKRIEAGSNDKYQLLNTFATKTSNDFNGKLTDLPYFETLKSIQKNTRTTELPVYALTLSLKPLIPNELEFDPYYPKVSTTTEAYYTPIVISSNNNGNDNWSKVEDSTESSKPVKFEFPAVLPDLNSLDDIVDRRKLLYIPRIKYSR